MRQAARKIRSFSIDGLFCEDDCKALKAALDGKSFYNFKVFWGSWAGNCVLSVETDYPHGTIAEVKSHFIWLALVTLAEAARALEQTQKPISK